MCHIPQRKVPVAHCDVHIPAGQGRRFLLQHCSSRTQSWPAAAALSCSFPPPSSSFQASAYQLFPWALIDRMMVHGKCYLRALSNDCYALCVHSKMYPPIGSIRQHPVVRMASACSVGALSDTLIEPVTVFYTHPHTPTRTHVHLYTFISMCLFINLCLPACQPIYVYCFVYVRGLMGESQDLRVYKQHSLSVHTAISIVHFP